MRDYMENPGDLAINFKCTENHLAGTEISRGGFEPRKFPLAAALMRGNSAPSSPRAIPVQDAGWTRN